MENIAKCCGIVVSRSRSGRRLTSGTMEVGCALIILPIILFPLMAQTSEQNESGGCLGRMELRGSGKLEIPRQVLNPSY